ncbi:MAG: TonB-dependent receptor, partial [Bacteroidales bacterium]|nr:TonB-dependent receptor [Bacteroidales bacterium]
YATDFLRHKASAFVDHKIISKLSARWDVSFQKRDGTYLGPGNMETSYKPFALLDVRLLWSAKKYKISVEATNLFNTNYLYIGNLPQPGRWIKAGLSISI